MGRNGLSTQTKRSRNLEKKNQLLTSKFAKSKRNISPVSALPRNEFFSLPVSGLRSVLTSHLHPFSRSRDEAAKLPKEHFAHCQQQIDQGVYTQTIQTRENIGVVLT